MSLSMPALDCDVAVVGAGPAGSRTARDIAARGLRVRLLGEDVRAGALDRVRWDETLCEQAQRAGADLVRARLVNAERENGHVRLFTQTDGRQSSFTARP